MICYLVSSTDKFELPVGVYDNLVECSRLLKIPYQTLYVALSRTGNMPHYKLRIERVQVS
jgi:hypothetical protein